MPWVTTTNRCPSGRSTAWASGPKPANGSTCSCGARGQHEFLADHEILEVAGGAQAMFARIERLWIVHEALKKKQVQAEYAVRKSRIHGY